MKISLIELAGYRRFRLARLNKVVYRPTARQQLILGTNGSGKSSLLDELSPLPAHHSNFTAGGYKHIEIEHGAHQFVLRSDFKSGNRHSFKKDGVELNEGGTYQVQLRLVREEFRYTEKLHDLLTGRLRFTEMRPQERREWITALSESDWTYALGVYNQFRSKARDAQGAYKHQQERLTQEVENLSKLSDYEVLKARSEVLRNELNALLTNITPNTPEYSEIVGRLETIHTQLQQEAQALVGEMPPVLVSGQYSNIAALQDEIRQHEEQAQYHRVHIERASRDFTELEAMLAAFGSRDVDAITDAPEQLASVIASLQTLPPQTGFGSVLVDGLQLEADNRSVLLDLQALFRSLPDNSDRRYSRSAIEQNDLQITQLQNSIDQLIGESNRMNDRLSHLKQTHDSTCPRCAFVWKEGVNPQEVEYLETQLLERSKSLCEAREALQLAKEYAEAASGYVALWGRFRSIVSSYPRLKPLWDRILDEGLLERRPNEQLWIIREWELAVTATIEREALQVKQARLEQIVEAQRLSGDRTLLTEKIRSLEQDVQTHTAALHAVQARITTARAVEASVTDYLHRLQRWQSRQENFNEQMRIAIDAIKNRLLNEDASIRHMEMASLQKHMSDHQTLTGIVDDITREVGLLEARYKSYQLLAAIMSPTEGIIAERLREAIFSIVDQMNTIIGTVWTYEMRILECGFEQSDLDYKFPVSVESPDNVTSDISRCSKGQKEMIDIAFKLTAMLYLEMQDYPLFMDEPGEGFDEQHRDQIMSLIRSMLDSGHYSQLFMVSHFATNHGSFLDAQILVLDSSNIALPGTFNEHATLE